jgi:hypothetical protein
MKRGSASRPSACVACPTVTFTLATLGTGFTAAGLGDGFVPTLAGGDRMYALNHHALGNTMTCVSRVARALCPGYASNRNPGTHTAQISPLVYDADTETLWFPAQTNSQWGFGCWKVDVDDSTKDGPCTGGSMDANGHLMLQNESNSFSDNWRRVRSTEVIPYDGKLYAFDDELTLWCADPTTRTSCGSAVWPGAATVVGSLYGGSYGTLPMDVEIVGSRVYIQAEDNSPKVLTIACWDFARAKPCAEFGTNGLTTPIARIGFHSNLMELYSGTTFTGICARAYGDPYHICRSTTGAVMTAPAGLASYLNLGCFGPKEVEVTAPDGSFRSYIPLSYCDVDPSVVGGGTAGGNGRTLCWNWTTGTSCGMRRWENSVSSGGIGAQTRDYGYVTDGECIYGLGDASRWWAFNTDFAPCTGARDLKALTSCACIGDATTSRWGTFILEPGRRSEFSVLKLEVRRSVNDVAPLRTINLLTALDADDRLDLDSLGLPNAAKLYLSLAGTTKSGSGTFTISAQVRRDAFAVLD